MPKTEIVIRKGKASDLPKIKASLHELHLDGVNISARQFVVVLVKGRLAGFGRIKTYKIIPVIHELCTLGVFEPYREQGIGSEIVKKLIENNPGKEIWLVTGIPEYFKKLGFSVSRKTPKPIQDKIDSVCKFHHHGNFNPAVMKRSAK